MCHTETMSTPSLSEHLALVAAEPALAGHPAVEGLVMAVDQLATDLAALREENADLWRQLNRHSGNSGQPPSQDGPAGPPRSRSRRQSRGRRVGGPPGPCGPDPPSGGLGTGRCPCGPLAGALPSLRRGPALSARSAGPTAARGDRAPGAGGTRSALPDPDAGGLPARGGRTGAVWAAPACPGGLPALCAAPARGDPGHRHGREPLPARGGGPGLAARALRCVPHCDRLGNRGDVWTAHVSVAVHDRFRAYTSRLPNETVHALCNAHLLRNLKEIVELEREPEDWAAHWVETTGGPVPKPLRERTAAAWDALLLPVLDHYESLPPPARGHRRGHNLASALWTDRASCLLFMADPRVPFTNNRAEQALRMVKLQMKISAGFRTGTRAAHFALVRVLLATERKQDRDLLAVLMPDPIPT